MSIDAANQTAMDEQVVDNSGLEEALEKREKAKVKKTNAEKSYAAADADAKAQVEELALSDGAVVRCGRFRIKRSDIPSRSVAFETNPASRLSIGVVSED